MTLLSCVSVVSERAVLSTRSGVTGCDFVELRVCSIRERESLSTRSGVTGCDFVELRVCSIRESSSVY